MPQDAFTIYHTAKELNYKLKNARIDRINQPEKDTVIFFVRTNNKNEKLIISANAENARVCLTDCQKEAPLQAPSFCMLLRKHLSHAVIESFSTIPYERILTVNFSTKNEMFESGVKTLYVEIMGKYSNMTLVENGKILGAVKQSQSIEGLRPIFPGVKYVLPAPQAKIELSDQTLSLNAIENFTGSDFANYIFNRFKGLAKSTATEIVYRFFNKYDVSESDVKNIKITDFYKHFKDFYELCNYNPCVCMEDGIKDFYVTDYLSVPLKKSYYDSISSAIDNFFNFKESKKEFSEKIRKLTDAVRAKEKKVRKKYQIALEKIIACEDMQNLRIYGELIIANLYRIESGKSEVVLENYYTEGMKPITVKMDPLLSPKENAEKYFKKYDKEKKTLNAVKPQVKELEEELKYLQSLYDEIDLCKEIYDITEVEEELIGEGILKSGKKEKKNKKPTPYRTYQFNGYEIFVGRNNLQNTRLTSSAERNDMWLHTKDYHSAHVIIKSRNGVVPDEVLLFAAEICAYYSKASASDKVPVDYTLKKYVKRPAGLPLGMVYYTDNKTILVTPNNHLK